MMHENRHTVESVLESLHGRFGGSTGGNQGGKQNTAFHTVDNSNAKSKDKSKGKKKPKCSICGYTSHIKSECKWKDEECSICKKTGHRHYRCPSKDKTPEEKKAKQVFLATYEENDVDEEKSPMIIFGTGGNHHYAGDRELFEEYEEYSVPKTYVVAGGTKGEILGEGVIVVEFDTVKGEKIPVAIPGVRYIEDFKNKILLSGGEMHKIDGINLQLTIEDRVKFDLSVNGDRIKTEIKDGLFRINP
jgi:hypothetical protein